MLSHCTKRRTMYRLTTMVFRLGSVIPKTRLSSSHSVPTSNVMASRCRQRSVRLPSCSRNSCALSLPRTGSGCRICVGLDGLSDIQSGLDAVPFGRKRCVQFLENL
jgi:hypothetical protein